MSGQNASGGFPGLLSQFDTSAFGTGLGQSELAMGQRYNQLGMTGSTPEAMDLGAAPSLTGGIPGEFAAGLGQTQTQDLGTTLQTALNNLQTAGGNKSTLLNTITHPTK